MTFTPSAPLDTDEHTTDFIPSGDKAFALKWNCGYDSTHDGGVPDLLPMKRSPGKHISTGVRARAVQRHDFPEGSVADFLKPVVRNRMLLGQCMEHALMNMLCQANPERFMPGHESSLELGGQPLFGTDDLLDLVDECVDEIKLTWMSARRDIFDSKLLKYKEQLASYVHHRGWRRGRLHMIYVNGYYKMMSRKATPEEIAKDGPVYRIYTKQYTERELIENWTMVANYC